MLQKKYLTLWVLNVIPMNKKQVTPLGLIETVHNVTSNVGVYNVITIPWGLILVLLLLGNGFWIIGTLQGMYYHHSLVFPSSNVGNKIICHSI